MVYAGTWKPRSQEELCSSVRVDEPERAWIGKNTGFGRTQLGGLGLYTFGGTRWALGSGRRQPGTIRRRQALALLPASF